ncbi:MAG TPA: hypothetical protein PLE19_11130 [Planctomycetota bacterium]|nr:hypothetical protein [Planctomycetota bacterium]HRR78974.1 hypothetical protein [Planctomycetota bacterium]HRT92996.1 hypothetical protein [Planctomycetota bacterium]
MKPESLFREAQAEVDRHKYLESEKRGYDLGHDAVDDWHRRYWTLWLRHRWLEHLLGQRCWEELEVWRFGRLRTLFAGHEALLEEIATLVRRGAENTDVVFWAARTHLSEMPLIESILTEVRINEIRCSRQCFLFAKEPED